MSSEFSAILMVRQLSTQNSQFKTLLFVVLVVVVG
jgi:hypothetical protein